MERAAVLTLIERQTHIYSGQDIIMPLGPKVRFGNICQHPVTDTQ